MTPNEINKLQNENRKLRLELQRYQHLPVFRLGIAVSCYISLFYFYVYSYGIRYIARWLRRLGLWLIDNHIEDKIAKREKAKY